MHAEVEKLRLQTLNSYDLFDTASDPACDQFTELGAHLFEAPICLVSIVGEHHQWFRGRYGLETGRTPRSASFCAQTLTSALTLVVPDATADPVFCDNQLVTGNPHVRFYAGAPLVDAGGTHLGTFCIIDTKPRAGLSSEEDWLLSHLATMVMSRLERRRTSRLARTAQGFAAANPLAILTADADGIITFWNRSAEAMFGRSAADAIGRPLDLIVPERFRAEHNAGLARAVTGAAGNLVGRTTEVVALRSDGHEFAIEMTLSSWNGARGREFGAQIQDISRRCAREKALQHLAYHDPLTGLVNRAGCHAALAACLKDSNAATLLAIDIDGLRSFNDAFGYHIGDALLQAIATRLNAVAATGFMVARLDGDAFALLLPDTEDPFAAREAAVAVLGSFSDPFRIGGHTLQVGLSIGIAMTPVHATEVEELLLRADLAMDAAKKVGGRQYRFFDAGMNNALAARRAFKDELRHATERGEWELFYQPQHRLDTGALLGVEALLRWRHPARGLLAPAAFLEVLETHAVAYEVGSWVVDEACRQLAAWRRAGSYVPRVSINLFAAQFSAGTLERVISNALEKHALHPGDLEIEVTETIALRPDGQIAAALQSLRQAGVHIAFDDFGTGFASLATLKQLPVSRLKIDRSFVEDVCEAPHSAAIVAAILLLAERLGLEVVAEGIETEAQRAMLLSLGCTVGQGYLLGRPADATQDPARCLMAA